MKLLGELLGLEEAKKPKCSCEDDPKKCKLHMKVAEEEGTDDDDEYDGSAPFTEDLGEISTMIDKLKTIINAGKFGKWITETDNNYGTDCESKLGELETALENLDTAYTEFCDEIDKAQ